MKTYSIHSIEYSNRKVYSGSMKTNNTGWCAANYTETDRYTEDHCGPIRKTSGQAMADAKRDGYEGIRFVHKDGYLYVDEQGE